MTTPTLTPLNLKVLLHCYVSPEPNPQHDNAVVQESLQHFVNLGAIAPVKELSNIYGTTPLGAAWVKAILATPLPVQAFIDSHGRVIE